MWALQQLAEKADVAKLAAATLKQACQGSREGVVKVGSICSGWGVGEIAVGAMNEALEALLPEDEKASMAQAPVGQTSCCLCGEF